MSRLLGLAAAAWLLTGCCTAHRTYPAPATTQLLAELARSERAVRTFRAKAKVDQFTPKGRIKVRVYLLATGEGKLRFEAVSPFDTPLVSMTSDGSRFASIDHQGHRRFTGEAKPCNIARLLGIELEARDVARALTGAVPRLPHDSTQLGWDACLGADVLVLRDGRSGVEQRIHLKRLQPSRWRVERVVVRDRRGQVLDLRYEGFHRVAGHWLPRVIKLKQPRSRSDVIIRYHRQETNVDLPAEAFAPTEGGGLPEEELTCP